MRWCAILLLVAGCERNNGAYCDPSVPCGPGATCNLATNECDSLAAPDLSTDDLGSDVDLSGVDLLSLCSPACTGLAPICVSTSCQGCDSVGDGELACSTLTSSPHCQTTGPSKGACVECRTSTDCVAAAPSCDPNDHVCRACVADGDCPSAVCDLTPGSASQFQCVPPNKVIYVDGNPGAGNDGNSGLTPAMAVARISVGVMKAMMNNALVVRIAAISGGSYNAENLTINNVDVALVGQPGATIKPSGNNNPALEVKGSSHVIVRNLQFLSGIGMNGDGILCSAAAGSVSVLSCTIASNEQYGVDANNCGLVTVERSYIGGTGGSGANQGGGLRVGKNFHIVNSFIVQNGNSTTTSAGGIAFNSPSNASPADLVNNTIADNTGSGVNAGASCANPLLFVNNLMYNNKVAAAGVSETNCQSNYACADDAFGMTAPGFVSLLAGPPQFVSSTDYHLQASSPCVDKGSSMAPAHDFDGQKRPDPKSGKVDIGADEVE